MAGKLAQNPTEENAFFGWPLLVIVTVIVIWLRREAMIRALATTGVVLALFSLGQNVTYQSLDTGIPGPWRLLAGLPVFDLVLTTRLALFVAPVIGILLAISVDRVMAISQEEHAGPTRLLWLGAVAAALLPIVPTPLAASDRQPAPHFITSGAWREYVNDDQSLVPIPTGWPGQLTAMWWSAEQRLGFKVPEGYFLGPDPADPHRTVFGTRQSRTSQLISETDHTNLVPELTEENRRQAREDAKFWKAAILVLPANHPHAETLRNLLDGLYGEGKLVDDVWLWDVRAIS